MSESIRILRGVVGGVGGRIPESNDDVRSLSLLPPLGEVKSVGQLSVIISNSVSQSVSQLVSRFFCVL